MVGIPIGLLYENGLEWALHKYLLHGLGKNRKSVWFFHWHEHHKKSRKSNLIDDGYKKLFKELNGPTKEVFALIGLAALHAPLLPVAPFFTLTVWYGIRRYHKLHKKAHLDPEWAKEHLAWHYQHHMGKNQDSNWCVSRPWFDHIMGTREIPEDKT